jgi:hypothetical protein
MRIIYSYRRPGSSVGTATGYWLDGPGIESRWGRDFPTPVQTGPGIHPASCTMGTVSFPGVKRPGRRADHPPLPCAEVENKYSYTSTPPLGPWWPAIGWPLPLFLFVPSMVMWEERGMVISAERRLQCVITDRPGVKERFFYMLRSVDCCLTLTAHSRSADLERTRGPFKILLMVVGLTFLISRTRTYP